MRRLLLVVISAALGLTAAGCGGSTRAASAPVAAANPSPTATSTPSPSASPAARPRRAPSPSPSPRAVVKRSVRTPAAVAGGTYAFPVRGCSVSYGHSHHDYPATDIFAARNCAFVAPTAGTVDEVSYTDNWSSSTNRGADRGGRSVSIVGSDGVRYYGSHLQKVAPGISPGVHVRAGQLLGYVGNSGSARGIATHLHFGLSWPTRSGVWWVRRGEVYPWPYLDSWRAGGNRSPAAAVAAEHRRQGDVPPCRSDC